MYKKRCRRCHKTIYSLSASGRWLCPRCGTDLAGEPLLPRDKSTANVLPVTVRDEDEAERN